MKTAPVHVEEPPLGGYTLVPGIDDGEPEPTGHEDETQVRLRVLLVDDSCIFLGTLRRLLETLPGIQVIGWATSGWDALEIVDQMRPDLLLMDLAMPEMDGLEASCLLSARPARPTIVIMSVHDLPQYRREARAAGADAFITKSDLVNQLQPLMHHLIQRSAADGTRPR